MSPRACGPCTYLVSPTGVGTQNLKYVLTNLVQANDVVLLADGVYRVGDLQVSVPNVTIRAQHVPSVTDTAPLVWLDGAIPYRYWNSELPAGSTTRRWFHAYSKDFCKTTLGARACAQLSVSYRGDQVFQGNASISQTLRSADLRDATRKVFYVDPTAHRLYINFNPGSTTEVTDLETALLFNRPAVGSMLQGVGVRHYAGNDHNTHAAASKANAAVYVADATSVVLRRDWFSFNAVRGVKTQGDVPVGQTPVAGEGVLIDRSTFDHNGELGLNAVESDGIIIQHSLFYRNNTKGFYPGGEAGGAKLLSLHRAAVVDNDFTANIGIGLWFDRSAYDATVADNVFDANTWDGFKYEVSSRATVTGNTAVGNGRSGFIVYEASQVALSHNLLRGNLVGIEIQEGTRTFANDPNDHDPDHDRIMPHELTFDVADIDVHANGFYYAPSPPTYARCDPTASAQTALDGCQYALAIEDDLAQRDATALDVSTSHDNFHRAGWPTDPTHIRVPVFIALWQAPSTGATGSGCTHAATARRVRWAALADFQCTGQEPGAATPWYTRRGLALG